MTGFELVHLPAGGFSLRSLTNGETYHPGVGPELEASLLHVSQPRLLERCRALGAFSGRSFVVWDVGLGAAANALSVVNELSACADAVDIELHSFERSLAPLEFALGHPEALTYVAGREELLSELLRSGGVRILPRFSWRLHHGDFSELIRNSALLPAPDAILYDPYSPVKNPEMWTLQHFSALYRRLDPARACTWTNYTRSTAVRVGLLLAGFQVGVGLGVGKKDETTIASNDLRLLDRPLGQDWLLRVRKSRNAAPFRDGTAYAQSPISDADFAALAALPQFRV